MPVESSLVMSPPSTLPGPPKICKIMALMAVIMCLGLLFYILIWDLGTSQSEHTKPTLNPINPITLNPQR